MSCSKYDLNRVIIGTSLFIEMCSALGKNGEEIRMSIHLEDWIKRRIFLTVWEGTQPVIDRFDKSAPLSCDFFILPQPVIGHDTDRSAADKGVDKALLIILSLLTDKQACLSEVQKKSSWHRRPLVKTLFFIKQQWAATVFAASVFDEHICVTFVLSLRKQHKLYCTQVMFTLHMMYLHVLLIVSKIFLQCNQKVWHHILNYLYVFTPHFHTVRCISVLYLPQYHT